MPTYDYICENCNYEFEQFQSITAASLRKCPECGKSKLKRLIGSGSGVIFKGSGFYQTDYRSDNYKNGQKKATSTNTSTSKKSKKETKKEGDKKAKTD